MPIYYQSGFSSGAFSKEFSSNIDNAPAYFKACRKSMNFILSPEGAAVRREGFQNFAAIQNEQRLWTLPLSINLVSENYVISFFQSKTIITRVETGSEEQIDFQPYNLSQLEKLSYAQTGTTLVLATEGVSPKIIRRKDDGTFEFRDARFNPGPVLDQNTTPVAVFVRSGNIEAGSTSVDIERIKNGVEFNFSSAQLWGTFAISEPSNESFLSYKQWTAGVSVAANEYVVVQNTTLYKALDAGTSNIPPTHQSGDQTLNGIRWRYWNKGTGYVEMRQHLGSDAIRCNVLVSLPPSISGEDNATRNFNIPAFCALEGFPAAVTIFQDRLIFAGSNVTSTDKPFNQKYYAEEIDETNYKLKEDESGRYIAETSGEKIKTTPFAEKINKNVTQRLWASVLGEYGNFDGSGDLDERAISVDVTSNKSDKIVWLASTDQLLVGTQSGIFPFSSLRPSLISSSRNVSDSCGYLNPLLINNLIIYTSETNNGLKSVIFNDTAQVFQSQNITLKNETAFEGLINIQPLQEPSNGVVCLRNDGKLVFFSFDITQGLSAAYEWEIHEEKIVTLATIGAKIFISTESGKSGYLDLANPTDNYKDFETIISEAYILTLPVGVAINGQVVGFFNRVSLREIRLEVANTQAIGINEGGDLIGRKASQGSDVSPKVNKYLSSSFRQTQENETIKIKSIDAGALTVLSYGIVYNSES